MLPLRPFTPRKRTNTGLFATAVARYRVVSAVSSTVIAIFGSSQGKNVPALSPLTSKAGASVARWQAPSNAQAMRTLYGRMVFSSHPVHQVDTTELSVRNGA